jgi:hypothetical protein
MPHGSAGEAGSVSSMGAETLDELLRALRAAVDRDVDVSPRTGVIEALVEEDPGDRRAAVYDYIGDEMMRLWAIGLLGVTEMRLSTGNGRCSMAPVSTEEPEDERGNEPLTPIYPFNRPGEAIDLYSGPIGGL